MDNSWLKPVGKTTVYVMLTNFDQNVANPLSDLISDDVFALLEHHNLLSEKGIRDYKIRMKFKSLREQEVPACDAIEQLREEYPYLQFDTVRKIVYKLNGRRS